MSSESEKQRSMRIQFSLSTLLLLTIFLSSTAVSYFRWPEWKVIQEFDGVLLDSVGIFSSDDTRMIHASHDQRSAIVRETSRFKDLCVLRADGPLKRAYISADGKCAILLSGNGDTAICGVPAGKVGSTFRNVVSARFSPDGSNYVLCFGTGDVQIWSMTGELKNDLKGLLKGIVFDAWVSRSNDRILTYFSTDPSLGWDAQIWEIQGMKTLSAWSSCTELPSDAVLGEFEFHGHTQMLDGRRIMECEELKLPISLHWPPTICVLSNNEKRITSSSDVVKIFESNHSAGWRGHLEQAELWIALAASFLLIYRIAKTLIIRIRPLHYSKTV